MSNGSGVVFDCRRTDLEGLGAALKQYRDGHSDLISWIEETTQRQENAQPGQTDSRGLTEQLAQQTVSISGSSRLRRSVSGIILI